MDLWEKLNLKDQNALYVDDTYNALERHLKILNPAILTAKLSPAVDFYLGFATKLAEVENHTKNVARLTLDDPVVWIAYPKQSSKSYTCEFNRDTGWAGFGLIGYEPVRQVAIDDDWSALRFRKVQSIKKMVRTFAMTDEGKKKVRQNDTN